MERIESYEANSIERNAGYQIVALTVSPHSLVAPEGAGGYRLGDEMLDSFENSFAPV